jgi:hypothetical protein
MRREELKKEGNKGRESRKNGRYKKIKIKRGVKTYKTNKTRRNSE